MEGKVLTMTSKVTPITPDMAGCWGDGSRGVYMGEHIQDIAMAYGWEGPALDSEHEHYLEAWDEADEFMQALAPEGFEFTSEYGDWSLVQLDEGDE